MQKCKGITEYSKRKYLWKDINISNVILRHELIELMQFMISKSTSWSFFNFPWKFVEIFSASSFHEG